MYKILPSWGYRRSSESVFLYLQLQTLFSCHMTSKVYFFNLLSRSNPAVAQAVKNICCFTLPCQQPVILTDTFTHTSSPNNTIHRRDSEEQNTDIFVISYSCLWLWKGPCISYKHVKWKLKPNILKVLIQPVNAVQAREGGDFFCKPVNYLPKKKPELNFLLKS